MRRLTTHLDRGLGNLPLAPQSPIRQSKNSPPLPQLRRIRAADEAQEAAANAVWASEDLKSGLESFAESGPGTAIFQGS